MCPSPAATWRIPTPGERVGLGVGNTVGLGVTRDGPSVPGVAKEAGRNRRRRAKEGWFACWTGGSKIRQVFFRCAYHCSFAPTA